ncbi:MAG: FkbM family methyltransferase, partial [Pseudomonadota bacterium]
GASAPVIFDVGANEGKLAQTYRKHFPDARIFCLEPIPHFAARLRASQPSAEVIESALASEDGTASFFVNAFEDTSSLLQSDLGSMPQSYRPMMQPKDSIKVRTAKLDTLMGQFGLDTIGILKMDIQGGEYNALKGAAQALERKGIAIIALEVFLEAYYADQRLFGEIASLLAQYGYHLHRLYNINFSGTSGRPQWADAIFVPDESASFAPQSR